MYTVSNVSFLGKLLTELEEIDNGLFFNNVKDPFYQLLFSELMTQSEVKNSYIFFMVAFCISCIGLIIPLSYLIDNSIATLRQFDIETFESEDEENYSHGGML